MLFRSPPGVDISRFRPLDPGERATARAQFGFAEDEVVVLGLSRLVPRKGFDRLIEAAAIAGRTRPQLRVAISGSGRDKPRLERLAVDRGAPVRFLGRVPEEDKPRLYGCVDVFGMLCRNRWAGLEQEGFGIVFVEAAACGVAQLAGQSGGAAEAVADGETGVVVRHPDDVEAVAAALARLVDDPEERRRMGVAARERAVTHFDYDVLAARLAGALGIDPARLPGSGA